MPYLPGKDVCYTELFSLKQNNLKEEMTFSQNWGCQRQGENQGIPLTSRKDKSASHNARRTSTSTNAVLKILGIKEPRYWRMASSWSMSIQPWMEAPLWILFCCACMQHLSFTHWTLFISNQDSYFNPSDSLPFLMWGEREQLRGV